MMEKQEEAMKKQDEINAVTQVDRSCHRISQNLTEKMRESHRIVQENTGNTCNMETVFRSGISRTFSDDSRMDPAGKHWNR
jgi:hypothetical protein